MVNIVILVGLSLSLRYLSFYASMGLRLFKFLRRFIAVKWVLLVYALIRDEGVNYNRNDNVYFSSI